MSDPGMETYAQSGHTIRVFPLEGSCFFVRAGQERMVPDRAGCGISCRCGAPEVYSGTAHHDMARKAEAHERRIIPGRTKKECRTLPDGVPSYPGRRQSGHVERYRLRRETLFLRTRAFLLKYHHQTKTCRRCWTASTESGTSPVRIQEPQSIRANWIFPMPCRLT